jgi:UrcA family protein
MKNASLKTIVTATALSLGVVFASQAGAAAIQEQALSSRLVETQSISIAYAGTDLASDEGRASLLAKIKRAAKEVCGPTGLREAGSLNMASRNRKCYEGAIEAAVSQVETGQVASLAS